MSLKLIIFYRKQRKKKRARAKKAAIANNANEANGEAAPGTDSDESKTNYLSFKHWKQWIAIKTSIKRDEGIQLEDCKVEETALVHPEPGPRRVIIRTKVTTDDQQVTKADMYIYENTCLLIRVSSFGIGILLEMSNNSTLFVGCILVLVVQNLILFGKNVSH